MRELANVLVLLLCFPDYLLILSWSGILVKQETLKSIHFSLERGTEALKGTGLFLPL